MLKMVVDGAAREDLAAGLDEIVRERGRGGCWPPRWKTRSPLRNRGVGGRGCWLA
jgi:hypothetical protein